MEMILFLFSVVNSRLLRNLISLVIQFNLQHFLLLLLFYGKFLFINLLPSKIVLLMFLTIISIMSWILFHTEKCQDNPQNLSSFIRSIKKKLQLFVRHHNVSLRFIKILTCQFIFINFYSSVEKTKDRKYFFCSLDFHKNQKNKKPFHYFGNGI
jgi:hypothetical protein